MHKTKMGYYPFLGLCRDREREPCVATMALCRDRVFSALCRNMAFLIATWSSGQARNPAWARSTGVRAHCRSRDRAFWLYVVTRFSVSRHGSQACWLVWVATKFVFGLVSRQWPSVVTDFGLGRMLLCCDKFFHWLRQTWCNAPKYTLEFL